MLHTDLFWIQIQSKIYYDKIFKKNHWKFFLSITVICLFKALQWTFRLLKLVFLPFFASSALLGSAFLIHKILASTKLASTKYCNDLLRQLHLHIANIYDEFSFKYSAAFVRYEMSVFIVKKPQKLCILM